MYSKSSVKDSYYGLKELYNELKNKNKKKKAKVKAKVKDEEKFEDVPIELSDKDKEGKIKKNSYMNFYLSVKSNRQLKDLLIPSGLTATNRNYADVRFVKDLDK